MEENELKVQEMMQRMSTKLAEEIEKQLKQQQAKITIYPDGYRTEVKDQILAEVLFRDLTEEQKESALKNLSNTWIEKAFSHLAQGEQYLDSYYEMVFKYYNEEKEINLPHGFPELEFDLTELRNNKDLTPQQKLRMYEEAVKNLKVFKTLGLSEMYTFKMKNTDKIYYRTQRFFHKFKSDFLRMRNGRALLNEGKNEEITEPLLMTDENLTKYLESKDIEPETIKKVVSPKQEKNGVKELEEQIMDYVENAPEENKKPGTLTEDERKKYEEKVKKIIKKMWEEETKEQASKEEQR